MYYFVYKTTNLINNKFYIGKHSTNNLDDGYLGSGYALRNAIKKYGKENFKREIIKIFNNDIDAYKYESEIVNEELINSQDCYNECPGGHGYNSNYVLCFDSLNNMHYITSEEFKNNTGKYHTACKNKMLCKDNNGKYYMVSREEKERLNLIPFAKNKIMVKDKDGIITQTTYDDPRYLSGELIPFAIGMVSVKDNNGKTFHINVNDPRYISGELKHVSTGIFPAKDSEGNTVMTSKTDPRYISGELKSTTCGLVQVKDSNNNIIQVKTDDPRYISGELKHIFTNKAVMKDKNGKIYHVDKNDPRCISGELVGIMKNKHYKHSKTQLYRRNSQNEFDILLNIDKNMVEQYIDDGWVEGRISSFLSHNHLPNQKIYVTKNRTNKQIYYKDVDKFICEGWEIGKYKGNKKMGH